MPGPKRPAFARPAVITHPTVPTVATVLTSITVIADALRPMIRLLTRSFEVPVALPDAWRELARIEEWPRWAAHIRAIDVAPPGPLGPDSAGTIHLRGGVRSTFRMEEFRPERSWKWAGPFLWLTVHYDHQFEALDPARTRLTWLLDAEGFGAALLGRLFAAIYSRNVDRAIPRLVERFASDATRAGPAP